MATEAQDMVVTTIKVWRTLTPDGDDYITVSAEDSQGELPTLVEMLGMLDMARDTAYHLARGEEDEDEDVEPDPDAEPEEEDDDYTEEPEEG